MEVDRYQEDVAALSVGKIAGTDRYLHASAVPEAIAPYVEAARELSGVAPSDFNVVKLARDRPRLSLLRYAGFMTEGFPHLKQSWSVDLVEQLVTRRAYEDGGNPPVLHRKELLLLDDHPCRGEFEALTSAAEEAGLFDDAQIIGHQLQWREELRSKRLRVLGHRLVPDDGGHEDTVQVVRHKTALRRYGLSTPMQALWRHSYLDGDRSVFDYGCGRGDDLATLKGMSVASSGWDPHFRPEGAITEADVVNLGFVINVIEDLEERAEALRRAYALAGELLVVGALIGGRTAYERYRLYQDGVLTTVGTFQKYFAQTELGEYIRQVTGRTPIPVGPGLYFVFRDDESEQTFLFRRRRSRSARSPLPTRPRPEPRSTALRRPSRWDENPELLQDFWARCLELGRAPERDEYARSGELREKLGTAGRVLRHLLQEHGDESLLEAQRSRMDDILIYLALGRFEGRASYGSLPRAAQRDVRRFWGSMSAAHEAAYKLLFSAGQPAEVALGCAVASETGLGHVAEDGDYKVQTSAVNELPAVLRIFVGCAEVLYGDVAEGDLVGIKPERLQLVVETYRDFETEPIPEPVEWALVDLRRRRLRLRSFDGDMPGHPLYLKSRFMPHDWPDFEAQRTLDNALVTEEIIPASGKGPALDRFRRILSSWGMEIRDLALVDRGQAGASSSNSK